MMELIQFFSNSELTLDFEMILTDIAKLLIEKNSD